MHMKTYRGFLLKRKKSKEVESYRPDYGNTPLKAGLTFRSSNSPIPTRQPHIRPDIKTKGKEKKKENRKNRRQPLPLLGAAQSIHCVHVKKRCRDWPVSPSTLFPSRFGLSRICISGDVYRQIQRKSARSANNSSLLLGNDAGQSGPIVSNLENRGSAGRRRSYHPKLKFTDDEVDPETTDSYSREYSRDVCPFGSNHARLQSRVGDRKLAESLLSRGYVALERFIVHGGSGRFGIIFALLGIIVKGGFLVIQWEGR